MPTDPSNSAAIRPSSFFLKKSKQKQPPPAAYENKGSRRLHDRSSSLGGFVARILPARREERGHTLRASFQDDGTQNAADLVFGVPETHPPETYHSDSTIPARMVARKPQSRPLPQVHHTPTRSHTPSNLNPRESETSVGVGRVPGVDVAPKSLFRGWLGAAAHIPGLGLGGGRQKRAGDGGREQEKGKGTVSDEDGPSRNQHSAPRVDKQGMQKPEVMAQTDPLLDLDAEVSKVQRMYLDKKARRAKRRSVRDSGDFLGVQGANPRTGYWDPSTGTSSSDPSQMSEETRRRIDQEANDLKEKKRKWEEAQIKLETELKRVQTIKDQKRSERAEQKKIDTRARQRRHGQWGLNDNGWSSVAEPELSTIIQSLAGTPMRETSPADRLFPMPSAAYPNPYQTQHLLDEDYFGLRNASSPATATPKHSIPRKSIGSPAARCYSTGSILNNGLLAAPSHYSPSSFYGQPHPGRSHPGQTSSDQSYLDQPPEDRPPSPFIVRNEIPKRKPLYRDHIDQHSPRPPPAPSSLRNESPRRKPVFPQHSHQQQPSQPPVSSKRRKDSPNRKPVFQPSPSSDFRNGAPASRAAFNGGPFKIASSPPSIPRNESPRRKPVQAPPSGTRAGSPEFKAAFHGGPIKITPPRSVELPRPLSPQRRSFLDKMSLVPMPGTKSIREAIATSYQSASTRQYLPRRPLAQNQLCPSPSPHIIPLNDFPRISLKDPTTARLPSNSPPNPHVVWAPPTFRETGSVDTSPTIIHTTTTIGQDLHRRPPTQFDGPVENEDHIQVQNIQYRSNQVPVRTSSQPHHIQNDMHRRAYQIPPADIVTLSEHQLTPVKTRTARLCQMTLPEGEEEKLRTIPTSTSMYPQTPIQGAYHAALQAFQNSRHKAAMKKTHGSNGGLLTPPRLRAMHPQSEINRDFMVVPGGLEEEDTGGHSGNRQHDIENRRNLYKKNVMTPTNASSGRERGRRQDGLIVWHQSPNVEKKIAGSGYHLQESRGSPVRVHHQPSPMAHRQVRGEMMVGDVFVSAAKGQLQPGGSKHPKGKSPKSVTPEIAIVRTMIRVIQTAWWLVEPVFDPHSAVRQRWEQRRLTWKDIILMFTAAAFAAGILMITLVLARMAGLAFQAVRGFMGILRILIGV